MRPPRVLVTGSEGLGTALAHALRARGVEPVVLPLLSFETVADRGEVMAAIGELGSGLIALTSPRAAAAMEGVGPLPAGITVAVVGPGTAVAATARGVPVDLVADGGGAAGLARKILATPAATLPRRALWLRGDRSLESFAPELEAGGFAVRSLVVYRTMPREMTVEELEPMVAEVSAWCAGSPSAVDTLVGAMEGRCEDALSRLRSLPAVAIGGTTAAALRRRGFSRVHEASAPDPEAFAGAALVAITERAT